MKKAVLGLVAIVVLIVGFMAFKMLQPVPDDLDLRSEKLTDNGLYNVSFTQEEGQVGVGPITTFLVTVKNNDGQMIDGATILVDGGMPQHGHGLPTQPRQTEMVSSGVYRIDGVKFSMTGWWEFRLAINSSVGDDTITFNVVLE